MSGRIRNILIAVFGIIFVGLGLLLLARVIQPIITASSVTPTPQAVLTEQIFVASRDIPLGALLTQSDIVPADIPIQYIPRNAVRDVGQIVGRFTKAALVEGEMVLEHQLADPTNVNRDLAYILSDEHVLMAFPAKDLLSSLGIIERGNLIDIFVSLSVETKDPSPSANTTPEEETLSRLFTFDALQRVSITAMVVEVIPQEDSGSSAVPLAPQDGDTVEAVKTPIPEVEIQAYLLALDPQDALVLKNLRDSGAIFDVVLRSPTSNLIFELDPVMEEYIRELYGLNIIP
jgi:Flp pilus assembly protein CpaB